MQTVYTSQGKQHEQDTEHRIKLILSEARMVLPGIQALLGFQLIAVFNQAFTQILTPVEQCIHLIAIFSSLSAIAILLTPAALHRQSEPDCISRDFANIAGRLVAIGMAPLMLSFCLEWYIVADLVLKNMMISIVSTIVVFASFLTLWVIWPQWRKAKNRINVDFV